MNQAPDFVSALVSGDQPKKKRPQQVPVLLGLGNSFGKQAKTSFAQQTVLVASAIQLLLGTHLFVLHFPKFKTPL